MHIFQPSKFSAGVVYISHSSPPEMHVRMPCHFLQKSFQNTPTLLMISHLLSQMLLLICPGRLWVL